MSAIRQNWHLETEAAVNRQINIELSASYVYQSMKYHFSRDDVALHGFAKFFAHNSDEEREHGEKFMKYLNDRGGRVVLSDVKAPAKAEWGTGLDALQSAFDLEKEVNQALLDLHAVASKHNDVHLADYLESEFLNEQVEAIKDIGDKITQLKRAGSGLGEHLFDKDLQA